MVELLLSTFVILWDEVVLSNKNTIAALDVTLRDITEKDAFMSGIPFVCAGDCRENLPVIRGRGRKNDGLNCCLKSSYFWPIWLNWS